MLRLQWDDQRDVFIYDLKGVFDQANDLSPTKRNILKTVTSFENSHIIFSFFATFTVSI